jgi:hypothetical protein
MKLRILLPILLALAVTAGFFLFVRMPSREAGVPPGGALPSAKPRAVTTAPRTLADGSLVLHLAAAEEVTPPWTVSKVEDAAAGTAVEVPPGAGKGMGTVRLAFTAPRAGRYVLWLRAFWGLDGEAGCSNSVAVLLNGASPVTVQDGTYGRWHWVPYWRGEAVDLRAGGNTLSIQSREDGLRLDQVLFAPWHEEEMDRRVPQGVE